MCPKPVSGLGSYGCMIRIWLLRGPMYACQPCGVKAAVTIKQTHVVSLLLSCICKSRKHFMIVWLPGSASIIMRLAHQSTPLSFTKGCPRAQELAELARIALSTEARLSSRMAKQPWHFSLWCEKCADSAKEWLHEWYAWLIKIKWMYWLEF